ncbi:MAG TPA: WhiB family transcriptional regulator [Mycobacteriales bacterium]|nr:WhiB family transcriptional regulator [Mycobacteriales bacterium]
MSVDNGCRREADGEVYETSPGDPLSAWVRWAACAGRPAMFDDPERVNEALRLCSRCPVLVECRLWALLNAVHGVAGGMTEGARTAWRQNVRLDEPEVSIADFLPLSVAGADQGWGLGRSKVILRAVAERTAKGQHAQEIADELGVTRRTIERLKKSAGVRAIA